MAATSKKRSTFKQPRHVHPPKLDHEHIVLVLQGGGALGAYQAGVYEALCKIPTEPRWVAGVSIGAINAALIAGNEPHWRLDRLQEFWKLVTSRGDAFALLFHGQWSVFHQVGASMAAVMGVPGFFKPRFSISPQFLMEAISASD